MRKSTRVSTKPPLVLLPVVNAWALSKNTSWPCVVCPWFPISLTAVCACAVSAPSSRATTAAASAPASRGERKPRGDEEGEGDGRVSPQRRLRATRAAKRGARKRNAGGEGRRPSPAGWRSDGVRLGRRDAEGAEDGAVTTERPSVRQVPERAHRCALALWRSGALALWRSGALALWRSGALALWRSGALALWRSGALALWRSGALALWRSGALALIVTPGEVRRCQALSAAGVLRPRAALPPRSSRFAASRFQGRAHALHPAGSPPAGRAETPLSRDCRTSCHPKLLKPDYAR